MQKRRTLVDSSSPSLTKESVGALPTFLEWVSLPGFSRDLFASLPALLAISRHPPCPRHSAISFPAKFSSVSVSPSFLIPQGYSTQPTAPLSGNFQLAHAWPLLPRWLLWPHLIHCSFLWPGPGPPLCPLPPGPPPGHSSGYGSGTHLTITRACGPGPSSELQLQSFPGPHLEASKTENGSTLEWHLLSLSCPDALIHTGSSLCLFYSTWPTVWCI